MCVSLGNMFVISFNFSVYISYIKIKGKQIINILELKLKFLISILILHEQIVHFIIRLTQ